MPSLQIFGLGLSLLLSAATVNANKIPDDLPTLQWGSCPDAAPYLNATAPIECTTIRLPLDYTKPNSTLLWDAPLLRVKAPKQPSRGSILVNWGGPGIPAIPSTVIRGQELLQLSGGSYDIVALDPRGTDDTLRFTCTSDQVTQGLISGLQLDSYNSPVLQARMWAVGSTIASNCATAGNGAQVGGLVSTAFTARDMARIAEVLDEDGLIRYWGFSYGSVLGETIAAMFPGRIERMIIDGVVNPHEWFNDVADFQQWESADATWSYFFETCIEAGPEKCPMAALNKTAEELESDMWAFFDRLLEVPISNSTTGMFLDSIIAKGAFFQASYSVANWPKHAALYTPLIWGTPVEGMAAWAEDQEATAIAAQAEADAATEAAEKAAAREGNDPTLVAAAMTLLNPPNTLNPIDKFWAIHCSDRNVRVASYKDLSPAFERLDKISKLRGSSHAITAAVCAQWPIKAKESYEGDFAVETKTPVLLMGLTYDAPSSVAGAYNASASFANSKVIEVEGAGHTSYSLPSVCAGRHIIAYWSNGAVPEDNIKCEADTNPWVEVRTWADVLKSLGQDWEVEEK